MKFSNLLRDEKTAKVAGLTVRLKKLPYGFMSYYVSRFSENKELKGRAKYDADLELVIEFLLAGLLSWDLQIEGEGAAPLAAETVQALAQDHPDLVDQLTAAILDFNTPGTEEKKTSTPA